MKRLISTVAALAAVVALGACSGPTDTVEPTPSASAEAQADLIPIETMAALGDSMTLGVNACGEPTPCTKASWSTGSESGLDSIAQRIEEATGTAPSVDNLAKTGVKISQMGGQVSAAIKEAPDLVTVLVGNNDVCGSSTDEMTSVEAYRAAAASGLKALAGGLPSSVIYISSVPDLAKLTDLMRSDSAAQAVWARGNGCATVTGADAPVSAVSERIEGYNAALSELCSQYSNCVFDDGALFDFQPTAEDISTIDYFHVSKSGQHEIAAIAWGALEPALATSSGRL
ncbi:GDSL-type esterase/lipase family protein [Amnibacterium flavum]|uniref:SGNH hydrolase-type esterase domain-containing protein n=1 Tax=Amnibacterium flavum TaxID=2173173 RepID=A0A2V1HTH4_9MICO|nr:GDSL-type esterase/lipase family protein [Amnibacterium flavum]PVZ95906.1 hypothetical protein DDQ50_05420 [Amnibacterium flavum]